MQNLKEILTESIESFPAIKKKRKKKKCCSKQAYWKKAMFNICVVRNPIQFVEYLFTIFLYRNILLCRQKQIEKEIDLTIEKNSKNTLIN